MNQRRRSSSIISGESDVKLAMVVLVEEDVATNEV
jgi:hypothetical protein